MKRIPNYQTFSSQNGWSAIRWFCCTYFYNRYFYILCKFHIFKNYFVLFISNIRYHQRAIEYAAVCVAILLDYIECMRCRLLLLMLLSISLSVCHAALLSSGVQKRLNGLRSCLGCGLSSTQGTLCSTMVLIPPRRWLVEEHLVQPLSNYFGLLLYCKKRVQWDAVVKQSRGRLFHSLCL